MTDRKTRDALLELLDNSSNHRDTLETWSAANPDAHDFIDEELALLDAISAASDAWSARLDAELASDLDEMPDDMRARLSATSWLPLPAPVVSLADFIREKRAQGFSTPPWVDESADDLIALSAAAESWHTETYTPSSSQTGVDISALVDAGHHPEITLSFGPSFDGDGGQVLVVEWSLTGIDSLEGFDAHIDIVGLGPAEEALSAHIALDESCPTLDPDLFDPHDLTRGRIELTKPALGFEPTRVLMLRFVVD